MLNEIIFLNSLSQIDLKDQVLFKQAKLISTQIVKCVPQIPPFNLFAIFWISMIFLSATLVNIQLK